MGMAEVDVRAADTEGVTPLMIAVQQRHNEVHKEIVLDYLFNG